MPSAVSPLSTMFSSLAVILLSFIPLAIGLLLLYFVIKKAIKDALDEYNHPKL